VGGGSEGPGCGLLVQDPATLLAVVGWDASDQVCRLHPLSPAPLVACSYHLLLFRV
jgi:hypothetical protein